MKYIYIVSFLPSSTTVYVTKKGSCRHNLLTIKYFSTVVDFTTLQVRYFVCRTSKLCSSRVKVAVAMCAVTRSKLVKVRASNTDSQYIYSRKIPFRSRFCDPKVYSSADYKFHKQPCLSFIFCLYNYLSTPKEKRQCPLSIMSLYFRTLLVNYSIF